MCVNLHTQKCAAFPLAFQPHFHHLPPPFSHHQAMAEGKMKTQLLKDPKDESIVTNMSLKPSSEQELGMSPEMSRGRWLERACHGGRARPPRAFLYGSVVSAAASPLLKLSRSAVRSGFPTPVSTHRAWGPSETSEVSTERSGSFRPGRPLLPGGEAAPMAGGEAGV